jgi:hypothetical protein
LNSLEAILTLCALIGCTGILIAAVNEERAYSLEAFNSLDAKTSAITCGAIIDSMFSNSAEEYHGKLDCTIDGTNISATSSSKTKTFTTITSAVKNATIEVKMLEHYTK